MNVTIENVAPCRKLLRLDVDANTVDQTFETVAAEIGRSVKLPGFRPGKIPKSLITKNFGPELEREVRKKLINDSYNRALKEHKLHVVGAPDIKEGQFGRNQNFTFDITVETAPEFELPEYRGLPAKKEKRTVNEADMERAFKALRDRLAKYNDVERAAKEGDFAVVHYTATSEGKPLTDFAPTARGLTQQQNFWLEIGPGQFVPGFTEQLVGAVKGEKRTVKVTFPEDFVTPQLAGKEAVYEVELVQVKEKLLPELDDAFAKEYGVESLEKLREGVRKDLETELDIKIRRHVRAQIIEGLSSRVQCELPETLVQGETRSIVYDIVAENTQRGASKEAIDEKKDEIYNYASNSAREKLKIAFLLGKIAEKEGIKVTQQEVAQRVYQMAMEREMKPEKLIKELRENQGFNPIYEQILTAKTVDFLEKNAAIEEVEPSAETPSA